MAVRATERAASTARYVRAIGSLAQATLDGLVGDELFDRIAHEARRLARAHSAIVLTVGPRPGVLTIRGHTGAHADLIRPGTEGAIEGTLAETVVRTGRSLVIREPAPPAYTDITRRFGLGPVVSVPLMARGQVFGAMSVAQSPGGTPFGRTRVALVEAFAGQAALALEFQQVRTELRALAVVEERERIARELHDGAIQTLFGLGMQLDHLADDRPAATSAVRLTQAVDRIDDAISSLRLYIGRLRGTSDLQGGRADAP